MEQRASVQVNIQFLCHSTLVPSAEKPCAFDPNKTKYSEALKIMQWFVILVTSRYAVMCNKYGTQPFIDIEENLLDRFMLGNKSVIIDSSNRNIDSQQCAAIIETLRYDQ